MSTVTVTRIAANVYGHTVKNIRLFSNSRVKLKVSATNSTSSGNSDIKADESKTTSQTGSKSQLSHYISRVLTQLGGGIEVTKVEDEAILKYQGLSFPDYNVLIRGNPDFIRVLQHMQGCSVYALHFCRDSSGTSIFDFPAFTANSTIFMKSSKAVFSQNLYDANITKAPLVSKTSIKHVGKTSYSTVTGLFTEKDEFLAEHIKRFVFIDKAAKKPTVLPEWWFKKYQRFAIEENELQVEKLSRPKFAECFKAKVTWSDTDQNNHANWMAYHKYCLDAAYHFARANVFDTVKVETFGHSIKSFKCIHIGEAVIDDLLDVYIWEGGNGVLNFDIVNGKHSIYQSTFEFH